MASHNFEEGRARFLFKVSFFCIVWFEGKTARLLIDDLFKDNSWNYEGGICPGEIPHSSIVERDLQRRRPFQSSGKGYRDTLFWETIVRGFVEKDATTVLITANIRDFAGVPESLHQDLKDDVSAKTKGKGNLVLSKDLLTFTDTFIVPYLTSRKDFAALIQADKVSGLSLNEVAENHIDTLVSSVNEDPSVMLGEPDTYEPEVDVIEISSEFHVEQACEVSKTLLLVVFEFQALVYFTYFLPISEYFSLSDEESSKIAILDSSWNEHVMQVESQRDITFKCRLTFNSNTKEVESFEVESLEGVS